MQISMHTMTVDSFVPMLVSLGEWLDKAEAHAKASDRDLVNARLAPDMFTLAQQVQLACFHARNGALRLTGEPSPDMGRAETSFAGMRAQLAATLAELRALTSDDFAGAEERDCSTAISSGMKFQMGGVDFLRAWAVPHFYFHVVTAYGILRHHGVTLGKQDYLSQVGAFIVRTEAGDAKS